MGGYKDSRKLVIVLTLFLVLVFVQPVLAVTCSDKGFDKCYVYEAAKEKCSGQKVYACNYVGLNWLVPQYCWVLSKTCTSGYKCDLADSDFCACDSTNTYTYKCSNGDVYYFNKCNEMGSLKQDCGDSGYTSSSYCYGGDAYRDYTTRGCSGSSCYSSTSRKLIDDCESYEKCENGACKQKSCSELGYANSCTGLDPTKCISGNPYECTTFGNVKCYRQTDACTSNEKCVDPLGPTGAHCECDPKNFVYAYKCDGNDVYYFDECGKRRDLKQDCGDSGYITNNYCNGQAVYRDYTNRWCSSNACQASVEKRLQQACQNYQYCSSGSCNDGSIKSATWSKTSAYVLDKITLTASVSGMLDGTKIRFEIREDDPFSGNLLDTLYATVSAGKASTEWTVKYTEDWWGKPEMSFKAMVDAKPSISATSNEIVVSCKDITTGNRRCSSDNAEEEWINGKCKLVWKTAQNCNDADKVTDWSYSCDSSNGLVKARTVTDGSCSSGICKALSKTESSRTQCSATQSCDAARKACMAWTLSDAKWNKTSAYVGDGIKLSVSSANIPNGKKIRFEVWEDDAFFNDKVTTLYSNISNNKAEYSWVVPLIKDGVGKPEIFFRAMVDDQTSVSASSPEIVISCSKMTTGNKRCGGNILEEEWLSSGCKLSWSQAQDCDLLDGTSAWSYSCDASNALTKWRIVTDGYCDSASKACKTSGNLESSKTQCADNENCDAKKMTCVPCRLNSAMWSATSAKQGEIVTMSVAVPSCEGKEIAFEIMEDDGAFPDDFVSRITAKVSNGYATASWRAAYIEDQWGGPEFYFNAKLGQTSKTSQLLRVGPTKTDTDLGGLVDVVKSGGEFTIVTSDSTGFEASKYMIEIRKAVKALSGKTTKVIAQSQISSCWDYASLSGSLIVIGYNDTNRVINCLKTENSVEDRALNFAADQISVVSSPWSYGKYVIIVQGSDAYLDSIAALGSILNQDSSKLKGLKDSVVGCLWTGDMPTGATIACNIIPIVELIPDVRDSYRCVKDHPLTASPIPLSSYSDDSLIDEIVCKVTYAAAAYDIVGYASAIFTGIAGPAAAEIGDTAFATFKAVLKDALKGLERKVLEDAYGTFKLIPDLAKAMAKIFGDIPGSAAKKVDAMRVLIRLVSNGKDVTERGLKFLDANPKIYGEMQDAALAIDATTSLFKIEPDIGITPVIEATDISNIGGVLKISAQDKLATEIRTVSSSIGLDKGTVKGITFSDEIKDGTALGWFDETDSTIHLRMERGDGFGTTSEYLGHVLNNVVPHEMAHAKYAAKLSHITAASAATEEYLVDLTLRNSLKDDTLSLYKAGEVKSLNIYSHSDAFDAALGDAALETEAVAKAAQDYAEAGDYGLSAKTKDIEADFKYFLTKKNPKIKTAEINTKLTQFKDYSQRMKSAASDYLKTGVWSPPTDFLP